MILAKISYDNLNARQRENYNFQKVAARLADYGFNSLRLSDDWQGADFIACHIGGDIFLKVQLKSRLFIDKKYLGKNIHIAFLAAEKCYVYPHDEMVQAIRDLGVLNEKAAVWRDQGYRHWNKPPRWASDFLCKYEV
jgi:hypothetical protein